MRATSHDRRKDPHKRPFIVGIGGTPRRGSSSERALALSLAAAEAHGADTRLIAGPDLLLPIYVPGESHRTVKARNLLEAFRRCDGVIIASPSYHGSVSGLIKNALDYTEDLRADERMYWDDIAVGCLVCAGGWQAAGQTLAALRAIVHSLRGWPTPLGVMLNTSDNLFDEQGNCLDRRMRIQLETVGKQVVEFARRQMTPNAESRNHGSSR